VANQSEASLFLAEAPSRSEHTRVVTTASTGHFHVSRWFLASLMVAPWVIVAALLTLMSLGVRFERSKFAAAVASDSQVVPGKPGHWGQLEYRSLRIDLPDEFVFVPPPDQPPVHWVFHGYTKEKALEFLQASGITPAQRALVEKATWKTEAENVSVEPGDEFILSLKPDVRAKIYLTLVEFEENSRQIDPVWFRVGQVDDRLKDCSLSTSSIELLKSLLYPQGQSLLLFADFEPALRRLPNDEERKLFMNAVSRKRTLLAGLHVTPDSNMEAIIDYWGVGGRKKNVTPLLRALHHEGDAKVNIVCLLPDFPRDHIYMHPFSNSVDPAGLKQDCFWSAMNFFNDPPDNRVNDMNYLRDLLKTDYSAINQPTQLGDVVFLATAKDAVIHAAAYIADDVVFTKNGESYTQPWIFMHMEDMMDTYVVKHPSSGTLKALYYRKKTLF
jgi:hypothetical protein